MSQCILNLWLDMDKITNVYIESVKYSVLERHSKECDPKLIVTQLLRTNGTRIGLPKLTSVNTVTFFLTIQLKSVNMVTHIVFIVVFHQCMVLLENEICESMQKEISSQPTRSNSKNKYSYTSALSRTQWKKQTT